MAMYKKRRAGHGDEEPDLTAMISLMVVLIPFLLMKSAFTILKMNKVERTGNAASADAPQAQQPELVLDIYVYNDRFIVDNRGKTPIATLPFKVGQPDYVGLNTTLRALKAKYPTVNNALLRTAENVDYQHIIRTIDNTRVVVSEKTGGVYALFPEIQLASLEGTS